MEKLLNNRNPEPLLTTSAVSKWLGIATRTLCLWAECKEIPAIKVGHVYRVRREDLDAMMARHQGETAPLGIHRDLWEPETLGLPYRRVEDRRQPSIWDGDSGALIPSKRT